MAPVGDELTTRVAKAMLSMDLERDFWQKATGLSWMIEHGNAELFASARVIVERAIDTQTTAGHLNYNDRLYRESGHVRFITSTNGPATLAFPVLLLHERDPSDRYLDAAQRQYSAVIAAARTADGGLSAREEAIELWIDTTVICRFLARFGKVAGVPDAVDEAWQQLDVHVRHLVDPLTGLARHAWTERPNSFGQSAFWSRGNGWLGCAIVDLLTEAPNDLRAREATEVFQRLVAALLRHQDASGYWRNVVDDPSERLEASGTLMHVYAIIRGIELGLLEERDAESAIRGFRAVAGGVSSSGEVTGVAVPPGGPGVPFGITPFGQGFFLHAHQVLRETGHLPA